MTGDPAELLARAGEMGFRLAPAGDGFHAVPLYRGAVMPPGFLAELKRHRGALAKWMACAGCGKPTDHKRRCWSCGHRPCSVCGKASGSVLIETCFTCGVTT